MNRQAERILGERIQTGDSAALQELVTQYLPSVNRIADGHFDKNGDLIRRRGGDFDDLRSEAHLCLMRSAKAFNPDKGPFWPYLRNRIRSLLADTLRALRRRGPETESLTAEQERGLLAPQEQEPDEEVSENENASRLTPLLGKLNELERQAITLRYGLDGEGERNLSEISKELGVSTQQAWHAIERAMKRMRGEIPAVEPEALMRAA